jgi:hypothetical protein
MIFLMYLFCTQQSGNRSWTETTEEASHHIPGVIQILEKPALALCLSRHPEVCLLLEVFKFVFVLLTASCFV